METFEKPSSAVSIKEDSNKQIIPIDQEHLSYEPLSPENLERYKGRFENLKTLVSSAETEFEKALLTSPYMVSSVMGYDSVVTIEPLEVHYLYKNIQKNNLLDKFAFIPKTDGHFFSLVNIESAQKIIEKNPENLGVLDSQKPERIATLDQVHALFSEDNLLKRHIAIGLLSGFPKSSVLGVMNRPDTELPRSDFIGLQHDYGSQAALLAGQEASKISTTRDSQDYLQPLDFEPKITSNSSGVRFSGYGQAFGVDKDHIEDAREYAALLKEIDTKLGLSEYLESIRSTLPEELSDAPIYEKPSSDKRPWWKVLLYPRRSRG